MSSRKASESVTHPKITLPGRPGLSRKHHCPEHGAVMSPLRAWPKKKIVFTCKEGCRLERGQTDLK